MEIAHKLEAKLKAGAAPSGLFEEKLNESTQVAERIKSGRAEFHQNAADVFFVLSGEATLLFGGTIAPSRKWRNSRKSSCGRGLRRAMIASMARSLSVLFVSCSVPVSSFLGVSSGYV